MSLVEVAALVATHLRTQGIDLVVVGGSAITSHVPNVYISLDIDFAATGGFDRRIAVRALGDLGFKERGRVFSHDETSYTIDFVAEPPHIGRQPIHDFVEIRTSVGSVRVLRLEDAIADRVAAFLYWSDSESLALAERAAAAARDSVSWDRLNAALLKLETSTQESRQRIAVARERLERAVGRP
jgi:hypothetical protein